MKPNESHGRKPIGQEESDGPETWSCDTCGKLFFTSEGHNGHQHEHHEEVSADE